MPHVELLKAEEGEKCPYSEQKTATKDGQEQAAGKVDGGDIPPGVVTLATTNKDEVRFLQELGFQLVDISQPAVPGGKDNCKLVEIGGLNLTLIIPGVTDPIRIGMVGTELVQELRQFVVERYESCYRTCLGLYHNGARMEEFIEISSVEGIKSGSVIRFEEDVYSLREARIHVCRLKELLTDNIDMLCNGSDGQSLSFISHITVTNPEDDVAKGSSGKAGAVPNKEFVQPPTYCLPTADNLAPPLTAFYPQGYHVKPPDCLKTLYYSKWNPPSSQRKLKGDLLYLTVHTLEGQEYGITSCYSGFYINRCSGDQMFDPNPAKLSHHSHHLVGLMNQVSSLFKKNFALLQKQGSKSHPLEVLPSPFRVYPWIVPMQEPGVDDYFGLEGVFGSKVTVEEQLLVQAQDWNEQFQIIKEMPTATMAQKLVKEKSYYKLHMEYANTALKGAIAAVDGNIPPINCSEPFKQRIFIWNNIFLTFAFDSRENYRDVGGDLAARRAASHDLKNMSILSNCDIKGIHCSATVIVDYRGYRVVAQTIIPGILSHSREETVAYGTMDNGKVITNSEQLIEKLKPVAKEFYLKEETLLDHKGNEVNLVTSMDLKGIVGQDSRCYVLDLFRMLPPDANWFKWPDDCCFGKTSDKDTVNACDATSDNVVGTSDTSSDSVAGASNTTSDNVVGTSDATSDSVAGTSDATCDTVDSSHCDTVGQSATNTSVVCTPCDSVTNVDTEAVDSQTGGMASGDIVVQEDETTLEVKSDVCSDTRTQTATECHTNVDTSIDEVTDTLDDKGVDTEDDTTSDKPVDSANNLQLESPSVEGTTSSDNISDSKADTPGDITADTEGVTPKMKSLDDTDRSTKSVGTNTIEGKQSSKMIRELYMQRMKENRSGHKMKFLRPELVKAYIHFKRLVYVQVLSASMDANRKKNEYKAKAESVNPNEKEVVTNVDLTHSSAANESKPVEPHPLTHNSSSSSETLEPHPSTLTNGIGHPSGNISSCESHSDLKPDNPVVVNGTCSPVEEPVELEEETESKQQQSTTDKPSTDQSHTINQLEAAAAEVTLSRNDYFDIKFNVDLFTPGARHCKTEAELHKDYVILSEIGRFLVESVIPKMVNDCIQLLVVPSDGEALKYLMHSRGINMRYLGLIAELAACRKDLDHLYRLCVTEMIGRIAKRLLSIDLHQASLHNATTVIVYFLNCYLGIPADVPNDVFMEEPKKKNKKKRKPVSRTESLSLVHTKESLWSSIVQQVYDHFCYQIDYASLEELCDNLQVNKVVLLRRLCKTVGIQLVLKEYDFTAQPSFTEADIHDVLPVIRMATIKPADAGALYDLASSQIGAGNFTDAHDFTTQSMTVYSQVFGSLHADIANCYRLMARIHFMADESIPAMCFQHKAVTVFERVLGVDHPDTVAAYVNLALYCHHCEQTTVALRLMYRARYLISLMLGQDSPEIATCDSNIALMLHSCKEYELSLSYLEHALRLNLKYHGEGSLQVALNHHLIAQGLLYTGDFRLALHNEKITYNIHKKKYGEQHLRTKESADCLEQLTERAVKMQKKINEITGNFPGGSRSGVELPGQWGDVAVMMASNKKPNKSSRTKKKSRNKINGENVKGTT